MVEEACDIPSRARIKAQRPRWFACFSWLSEMVQVKQIGIITCFGFMISDNFSNILGYKICATVCVSENRQSHQVFPILN